MTKKIIFLDCDWTLLDTFKAQSEWNIKHKWEHVRNLVDSNKHTRDWVLFKDEMWLFDKEKYKNNILEFFESEDFSKISPKNWALQAVESFYNNWFRNIAITSLSLDKKVQEKRKKNIKDIFWNSIEDIFFLDLSALKYDLIKDYINDWECWLVEDNPQQAIEWYNIWCKVVFLKTNHYKDRIESSWIEKIDGIFIAENWWEVKNIILNS